MEQASRGGGGLGAPEEMDLRCWGRSRGAPTVERHTKGEEKKEEEDKEEGEEEEVQVEGKLMDLDDEPGLKQSCWSWMSCVSLHIREPRS